MVSPVNALTYPEEVVILSGQSLSAALNLQGHIFTGVYMPAAWTAASLTFQGSFDGDTYFNVFFDGSEISTAVAASGYYGLDPVKFFGLKYLKVRSGTSGTPVNQGADRTLTLALGRPSTN